MYELLSTLDRRWIFLLMIVAVATPMLLGLHFPEKINPHTQMVFDQISKLNAGDRVLISFDYDPSSKGELNPMAMSFMYQCAAKKLRMYIMALWPVGQQMADQAIAKVIKPDFPDMKYGIDYVNLGYKAGNEAVIKVIATDLRKEYSTDVKGMAIDNVPMMQGVTSLQDMKLIISISAGYPGIKEWVQYAKAAYPDKFNVTGGCTGVQAPPLLPYIPDQLSGLIEAIKGAAEYETLLNGAYKMGTSDVYQGALNRMGAQLFAHVLMVLLIIAGNVIYFVGRGKEVSR